jgi:hypothetical protein
MNNDSTVSGAAQQAREKTNQIRESKSLTSHSGIQGPRPPHSTLARLQLTRPRTTEEMRKLAQEVWRQRGLALIDPLLITDDFARQALINEANRLYGRNQTNFNHEVIEHV